MVLSYAANQPLVAKSVAESKRVEAVPVARPSLGDSEAADTWARTLEQIPTTAGKLLYVACLKQGSGRYHHPGLARIYSDEQADRVLRASHETVFAEWLSFSLEQQYNDLRVYILSSGLSTEETSALLNPANYEKYIPNVTHAPEQALYRADLETVLELLRREL